MSRRSAAKKTALWSARWRALLGPGLFTLIGLVVLCELGFWQLQRLAWKENLIARVEASRQQMTPLAPEADWPKITFDKDEYRLVTVSGTYDFDKETYAYTLLSDARGKWSGPGYWAMTPLKLADGSIVIVNRGFVPLDAIGRESPGAKPIVGEVKVEGLIRMPEHRSWFTPPDDPARGIWQVRDPAAIAKTYGLKRVAPFFIDANESGPGGLPQGGETKLTFPNNHLQYAITWFSFALVLLAVFLVYARRELKKWSA